MFWLSDLAVLLPPVEQLVQDQCLVPAELDNDVVVSCWMHALIMTDLPHPLVAASRVVVRQTGCLRGTSPLLRSC